MRAESRRLLIWNQPQPAYPNFKDGSQTEKSNKINNSSHTHVGYMTNSWLTWADMKFYLFTSKLIIENVFLLRIISVQMLFLWCLRCDATANNFKPWGQIIQSTIVYYLLPLIHLENYKNFQSNLTYFQNDCFKLAFLIQPKTIMRSFAFQIV